MTDEIFSHNLIATLLQTPSANSIWVKEFWK